MNQILKLTHKIRTYRKANISWYLNQSNPQKCKQARGLEQQISHSISHLNTTPKIYLQLSSMFNKAHWATTSLTPKR